MVRLEIAALYAGVNILILLVLGALVVRARITHKIALGNEGHKDMLRWVRAHANAAEYIPAGLVGLLILALLDPAAPAWTLHAGGISLTAGRILHGVGLHTGVLNIGRRLGMVLTFAAYAIIGVALIYAGLAKQL
ncbi:MAG: MAPEG family protein [Pseudomonadota bacterium]